MRQQLQSFFPSLRRFARWLQRWAEVLMLGLVFGGVLLIGSLVLYVVLDVYGTPPAVLFDRERVDPIGQSTFCPGDTVMYPFMFTVTHGPVVIGHRVTIYRLDDPTTPERENRTAQFDDAIAWAIYNEGDRIEETMEHLLPQLAPAEYELRVASQETARSTGYMFVPFSVRADCEATP
jgi:hypothetical protein